MESKTDTTQISKQNYETPRLRTIDLVTGEVLAGGCKLVVGIGVGAIPYNGSCGISDTLPLCFKTSLS